MRSVGLCTARNDRRECIKGRAVWILCLGKSYEWDAEVVEKSKVCHVERQLLVSIGSSLDWNVCKARMFVDLNFFPFKYKPE